MANSMLLTFLFLTALLSLFPLQSFSQTTEKKLTVSSPAFGNNQSIPSKYTCDGSNVNPPLTIENVPSEAKS